MALSPNSEYLYFGSPEPGWHEPIQHAVYRMVLDQPGSAERFLGEVDKSGADEEHFNLPRGVACDKEGNLYVADYGNDRIQVFRADGSFLKTLPVAKPEQLAVHPRSGEVYVLSGIRCDWDRKPEPDGQYFDVSLVKLGGLTDPGRQASLELPRRQHRIGVAMSLDAVSSPPAVWLAGRDLGVWQVEDRGHKFEKVLDATVVGTKGPEGWEEWDPASKHSYLAADPFREELYIRLRDCCFPSPVIRVDGRTGRVIEKLDLRVEQAYVGPDRLAYFRIEDGGEWLVRYDPDARKLVPFSAPETRPVMAGGYGAKKHDFAKRTPVTFRGQPVTGIYVPANYGARTWQDIFGVASNGDIYVPVGLIEEHIAELEKANLPRSFKPSGVNDCLLRVYSSEGRLECTSALPGLGASDGVRVGNAGAVYIVLQCQPAGQEVPEGIAPEGNWQSNEWGTLVKFNSTFDSFPVGTIIGRWDGVKPDKPSHHYGKPGGSFRTGMGTPVVIENVHWHYGGVAPVSMSGCTCTNSYFDLDRFERVFLPAVQTNSVNVLDANGNLVTRIGSYGNADSRGKDSPILDPKTGVLGPRRPDDPEDLRSPLAEPEIAFAFPRFVAVTDDAVYVHDEENERIVRAALGYYAEEVVSL
jgi:hypothetical protein